MQKLPPIRSSVGVEKTLERDSLQELSQIETNLAARMDSEGNTLRLVDQKEIEMANESSMEYTLANESIIQKLLRRTRERE